MSLLEHCIVPDWTAPPNVRALQTMRNGGISVAPYDSFNLGDHVGDAPMAVAHNRQLLSTLLPSEPVWLKQVHGTGIIDTVAAGCGSGCDTLLAKPADCGSSRLAASDETTSHSTRLPHSGNQVAGYPAPDGSTAPCRGGPPEADACIARNAGAVCVVMTADCLPVLLCDEQGSVVAAVHAGWRGLGGGVIEQAVRAMNVPPQSLIAWLGPAIGPQAFEVGEEVRAAFIEHQPQAAAAFVSGASGKYLADLYLLARQRLNTLGVSRIYGGGLCTYTDSERFFSYRRDGATGRMGTFIWLT